MSQASAAPTLLYRVYRAATAAIAPLAYRSVARKLSGAGVTPARQRERWGEPTESRPDGPLIWFHGASVGESLSVLTLITHLGARLPDVEFLMTSGTATSADLVAKRLPPRTRHQFAPLDAPAVTRRFLDHWRPDAAVFVESELWPNVLVQARADGARLALLNARLSEKSARDWRKFPDTARFVLDQFTLLIAQNPHSAELLRSIGAEEARLSVGTNLKATSDPLPVDAGLRDETEAALGGRPVWIASSTHPGEEEVVIAAHKMLLQRHPDLCLLLAPRHPDRGNAVADMLRNAGLSVAQRSIGEALAGQQVYLADTLGELGIWYALSPIVFLGGSLKPIGGHNPFEPVQSGAAVMTGPHVANFAETFEPLFQSGGAVAVTDAAALANQVGRWLEAPNTLEAARKAATRYAAKGRAALDDIVDRLCRLLETPE